MNPKYLKNLMCLKFHLYLKDLRYLMCPKYLILKYPKNLMFLMNR